MKDLVFNNCKSEEEVRATIEDALKYDIVVEDDDAASKWFKDAGFEGDVTTHVIVSTHVSVWNEEYQGEDTLNIIVKEHFIDSGSDDYVYSYSIC